MEPTFIRVSSQGVKVGVPCSWSQCSPNTLRILLRNCTSSFASSMWSWVSKVDSCVNQATPQCPLTPHQCHFRARRPTLNGWKGDAVVVKKRSHSWRTKTPLLHTPPSLVSIQSGARDLDGVPASKLLNCLVQVQLGERPLMGPRMASKPRVSLSGATEAACMQGQWQRHPQGRKQHTCQGIRNPWMSNMYFWNFHETSKLITYWVTKNKWYTSPHSKIYQQAWQNFEFSQTS